jgi:hypothetical protein
MMNSLRTSKGIYRTVLVFVAVALAGSAAVISRARTQTSSLTVTNSTNREVKHLYLSAPNSNNWGPDLLNDNVIPPGGSSTVGISCEQSSTKVIAEDQNGCFVSAVVSCGDNASWTITNNLTPDCGG